MWGEHREEALVFVVMRDATVGKGDAIRNSHSLGGEEVGMDGLRSCPPGNMGGGDDLKGNTGHHRQNRTSRQGAKEEDYCQPSHCYTPANLHFTQTRTCPGPLGVNLSAGPGSRPGRRLRGLACRLLPLFIVRLPSSCSLGLKVSSSGGLVARRLRCKQPELGITWHQPLPAPNSDPHFTWARGGPQLRYYSWQIQL